MFRNAALMLTSCLVCLMAGEAASRLVFDPIDILKVSLEEDPILDFKIPAHQSGHDGLGFRNKSIPETVDVLAIGDSMTYGNMASTDQSWPAHYARLSGQTVYNAGIGGYGPAHYLHNLKTLAPELKPQTVIFSIYVGNDFLDTYNLVYSNDNWSQYRDPNNPDKVEADPLVISAKGRVLGAQRDWLAHNSVLYRIATQSALFDRARLNERKQAAFQTYVVDHDGVPVLLNQKARAFTDVHDPKIKEGLIISQNMILEARDYCRENDIDFFVSIIPVKEQIYLDALPSVFSSDDRDELAPFAASLTTLHSEMGAFLSENHISFVDLKPALTEALKQQHIYPATDGHPNGLGYEVAARTMMDTFTHPKS